MRTIKRIPMKALTQLKCQNNMSQNPITIVSDIRTFFTMTKAIVKGQYKMPWKTFFWVLICAVYFLSPIDLLPDILPALGFADDGAFIVFVLLLIHKDLTNFRRVQQEKDNVIEAEIIDKGTKND